MQQPLNYTTHKFGFWLIALAGSLVFNFPLLSIIPGDPVRIMVGPKMRLEAADWLRPELGIDKPIWSNLRETGDVSGFPDSQLSRYVRNLPKGNQWISFLLRGPASELLGARLGPTILLNPTGEAGETIGGTILGAITAWKRRSAVDAGTTACTLSALALHPFLLGIILLFRACDCLPMGDLISPGTNHEGTFGQAPDIGQHMVLPGPTLAVVLFGSWVLAVHNAPLEVLAEDHVLTAKTRGMGAPRWLRDHAPQRTLLIHW